MPDFHDIRAVSPTAFADLCAFAQWVQHAPVQIDSLFDALGDAEEAMFAAAGCTDLALPWIDPTTGFLWAQHRDTDAAVRLVCSDPIPTVAESDEFVVTVAMRVAIPGGTDSPTAQEARELVIAALRGQSLPGVVVLDAAPLARDLRRTI